MKTQYNFTADNRDMRIEEWDDGQWFWTDEDTQASPEEMWSTPAEAQQAAMAWAVERNHEELEERLEDEHMTAYGKDEDQWRTHI